MLQGVLPHLSRNLEVKKVKDRHAVYQEVCLQLHQNVQVYAGCYGGFIYNTMHIILCAGELTNSLIIHFQILIRLEAHTMDMKIVTTGTVE